jgi:hypothetical protein
MNWYLFLPATLAPCHHYYYCYKREYRGCSSNQFLNLHDIAIDSSDHVYTSEGGNAPKWAEFQGKKNRTIFIPIFLFSMLDVVHSSQASLLHLI